MKVNMVSSNASVRHLSSRLEEVSRVGVSAIDDVDACAPVRPVHDCTLSEIVRIWTPHGDVFVAMVILKEDHDAAGAKAGDLVRTSEIVSLDLQRSRLETQNSVYRFERVRGLMPFASRALSLET